MRVFLLNWEWERNGRETPAQQKAFEPERKSVSRHRHGTNREHPPRGSGRWPTFASGQRIPRRLQQQARRFELLPPVTYPEAPLGGKQERISAPVQLLSSGRRCL